MRTTRTTMPSQSREIIQAAELKSILIARDKYKEGRENDAICQDIYRPF
jgi:hypothetical protein